MKYCPTCKRPYEMDTYGNLWCNCKVDWWERGQWYCEFCTEGKEELEVRVFDIDDMYHYGGQCPVCGHQLSLHHVYDDIPF